MQSIHGLTYGHLGILLREKGFLEVIDERGRAYTHPSNARLLLPPVEDADPVRAHHFVATRGMLDDFDLMPRDAFELRLLQLAHPAMVAA